MNKRGTAKYIWTMVIIVGLFAALVLTQNSELTGSSVKSITGMPVAGGEACLDNTAGDYSCGEGKTCRKPYDRRVQPIENSPLACLNKVAEGGYCERITQCASYICTNNHCAPPREQEQPQDERAVAGVSHSIDQVTGLREALQNAGGKLFAVLSPDLNRRGSITQEDIAGREISLEVSYDSDSRSRIYELFVRNPDNVAEQLLIKGSAEDLSESGFSSIVDKLIGRGIIPVPGAQAGEVARGPIQAGPPEIPGPFCVTKHRAADCPSGFRLDGTLCCQDKGVERPLSSVGVEITFDRVVPSERGGTYNVINRNIDTRPYRYNKIHFKAKDVHANMHPFLGFYHDDVATNKKIPINQDIGGEFVELELNIEGGLPPGTWNLVMGSDNVAGDWDHFTVKDMKISVA